MSSEDRLPRCEFTPERNETARFKECPNYIESNKCGCGLLSWSWYCAYGKDEVVREQVKENISIYEERFKGPKK